MGNNSDDGFSLMEETKGQHNWMKTMLKGSRSSKKKFINWGSKKLIDFLLSISKDINEPLTQLEVSDIIKDYIQENKLLHPHKKKKVLCDARLHSLFGRKSVNRVKVYDLLEAHFAANQESEDEFLFGLEDEDSLNACKRRRSSISDRKAYEPMPNDCNERVLEAPKYCYASVIAKNIKLVYLRKSLLLEFLKTPETFESRVMDCFVRIKGDPNDYSRRHRYQLVQVTGLKNTSEIYRTGEISTGIVLQVSNMHRDIHLNMVSEDDFSEEECEDLRQRVKDGLLKRPTMADLDKKARSLHEDIMNHWINREITLLQNLIDRANEKGWRRELFEYLERKELLQTPSERLRLLKELPKVVADEELELEATLSSMKDADRESKAGNGVASNSNQICGRRENEGNGVASSEIGGKQGKGNGNAINEKKAEREAEGAEVIGGAFVFSGQYDDMAEHQHLSTETKESCREQHMIGLGGDDLDGSNENSRSLDRKRISEMLVINLDDEDDHDLFGGTGNIASEWAEKTCTPLNNLQADLSEQKTQASEYDEKITSTYEENPSDLCEEKTKEDIEAEDLEIWHYIDPNGDTQGPFAMFSLSFWRKQGYFDENFKVWKTGQSQEEAILLKDALCLTFPKR